MSGDPHAEFADLVEQWQDLEHQLLRCERDIKRRLKRAKTPSDAAALLAASAGDRVSINARMSGLLMRAFILGFPDLLGKDVQP